MKCSDLKKTQILCPNMYHIPKAYYPEQPVKISLSPKTTADLGDAFLTGQGIKPPVFFVWGSDCYVDLLCWQTFNTAMSGCLTTSMSKTSAEVWGEGLGFRLVCGVQL